MKYTIVIACALLSVCNKAQSVQPVTTDSIDMPSPTDMTQAPTDSIDVSIDVSVIPTESIDVSVSSTSEDESSESMDMASTESGDSVSDSMDMASTESGSLESVSDDSDSDSGEFVSTQDSPDMASTDDSASGSDSESGSMDMASTEGSAESMESASGDDMASTGSGSVESGDDSDKFVSTADSNSNSNDDGSVSVESESGDSVETTVAIDDKESGSDDGSDDSADNVGFIGKDSADHQFASEKGTSETMVGFICGLALLTCLLVSGAVIYYRKGKGYGSVHEVAEEIELNGVGTDKNETVCSHQIIECEDSEDEEEEEVDGTMAAESNTLIYGKS